MSLPYSYETECLNELKDIHYWAECRPRPLPRTNTNKCLCPTATRQNDYYTNWKEPNAAPSSPPDPFAYWSYTWCQAPSLLDISKSDSLSGWCPAPPFASYDSPLPLLMPVFCWSYPADTLIHLFETSDCLNPFYSRHLFCRRCCCSPLLLFLRSCDTLFVALL